MCVNSFLLLSLNFPFCKMDVGVGMEVGWGGVTESSQHALGLNEEVPAKSILGVRGR